MKKFLKTLEFETLMSLNRARFIPIEYYVVAFGTNNAWLKLAIYLTVL